MSSLDFSSASNLILYYVSIIKTVAKNPVLPRSSRCVVKLKEIPIDSIRIRAKDFERVRSTGKSVLI